MFIVIGLIVIRKKRPCVWFWSLKMRKKKRK